MRKDETAENELNVITSVDHENIVRYYDHFELIKGGTKYLCIITEFCHVSKLNSLFTSNYIKTSSFIKLER